MVNDKYAIAYSEILEILKYIPIEDYNKIPKEKIELFETYADHNYMFNYDTTKTLEEQKVSNITKGIIILLFRDYWATEVQRNKIIAKQNYDRIKSEEKRKEKYNPNDLFKKKDISKNILNQTKENMQVIEYKEQKWYKKIFAKILNIFRKK